MSDQPWLDQIEKNAGNKRVLLVEGAEDQEALTHFLDHYSPAVGWRNLFLILPAGGKDHVRVAVETHLDWCGVVDRDEWSEQDLKQLIESSPRIKALPRFCMDSFFCDPDEIWPAIPAIQRRNVQDNPSQLIEQVNAALPAWVSHGAIWRVLRNLYRQTRFPAELDDQPVDEANMRAILENWHHSLAPQVVLDQYHIELGKGMQLTRDEQIKQYVHGKKFFSKVVVNALNHLMGQHPKKFWLQHFLDEHIQPPADLHPLLDWVLAQFNLP